MKVYNPRSKQLEFYLEEPSPEFWDKHWDSNSLKKEITSCKKHWILREIKKYLPKQSKILEGGCGKGQIVYSLKINGYESIGVDFASKTVKKIKSVVHDIDIRLGDVRKLDFQDNSFDGYISLGVIEHFKEGFDDILEEMDRVINNNGYLFLSFPYMSPIRRIKAKLGFYYEKPNKNFYQYALNHKSVIRKFQDKGFKLKYKKRIDGLKGFKDEIFKPILQQLYDYNGTSFAIKGFRKMFSIMLSPLFSHCIFLVFQKDKK